MQQTDTIKVDVFIGVDVAKTDHYACVVTASVSRCLPGRCATTGTAVAALFNAAAAYSATRRW